jgi:hypothetical protein
MVRPLFAQSWDNLSLLDATLPSLLLCVAIKGLAQFLNPLNATFTKNTGVGAPVCVFPYFLTSLHHLPYLASPPGGKRVAAIMGSEFKRSFLS